MGTLAFVAVVAAVVFYGVAVYNKLMRLRNASDSAWSDMDVQLKKRHDLVPNLVETVKGYAAHEQGLFQKVTETRSAAMRATGPVDTGRAETRFQAALRGLFAVAEAYPDLKASGNFTQLQVQLKEVEDGIEAARRYYNAVVRDLNTAVQQFPSNLVAGRFGVGLREYFELEAPAEERAPVKVSF
jgi:LemA protein